MNIIRRNLILLVIATALAAPVAPAQSFKFPTTRNAALRYWEAFALMQDQPIDSSTKALMEKTLSGEAAWDEQRLGALVDQNKQAIQIMQRGTMLPECEWGEDYSAGAEAPMPQVPKARALNRLNLLYGIRALAQHDNASAVVAFIAGMRFAQHLSQDGSLVSTLTAKAALLNDFQIVERALASGQLDAQSKTRIHDALDSLPKDNFDWAYSVRVEGFAEETALKQLMASSDPGSLAQAWFGGKPLPNSLPLPSTSDIAGLRSYINDVANAFHLPPALTQERLDGLEAKRKNLNPLVLQTVPNFMRLHENRKQLQNEREILLQQLKK